MKNGISFMKTKHVRVYGGVIKNCKKGGEANKLGGKGFQFEDRDIEDAVVDGTKIMNCSWGFSSQFDIYENALDNTKIEVSFINLYVQDCENLGLLHQINGSVDSDLHVISLNNIRSVNCGNSGRTSYSFASKKCYGQWSHYHR